MEAVICFEMLFPDRTPEQKVQQVAEVGFRAVEFWGWRDKDIPALRQVCRQTGVRVANFSGHRVGSPVAAHTHEAFLRDLRDAVAAAKRLDCRTLMILSNELGEGGRVLDSFPAIPPGEQYENLLTAVRRALKEVPEDFTLVLEPLNTTLDHPGYFLTDMQTAARAVRQVGDRRFRILCDLYHLGMMGVDLPRTLDEHIGDIGYFHVADFPGRHEPGSGSADWPGLLAGIRRRGYDGAVGFEYSPEADSTASLKRIRRLWEGLQD